MSEASSLGPEMVLGSGGARVAQGQRVAQSRFGCGTNIKHMTNRHRLSAFAKRVLSRCATWLLLQRRMEILRNAGLPSTRTSGGYGMLPPPIPPCVSPHVDHVDMLLLRRR